MADGERPRFNRGERTNTRGEGGPRPPKAGGGEPARRQRGRSGPQRDVPRTAQQFPEKPAFTFTQIDSPFNEVTEKELFEAHRIAAEILHKERPQLPLPEGDDARAKKLAYHRDEDDRLTAAFGYQTERKPATVRDAERRSHAFSTILEAMVLTGGQQLFSKRAVLLPAQYSDRKDATDVVVQLGKGLGLAIDAATEQDLDGYVQVDGTRSKGIDEKIARSYRAHASDFGNMMRVQYVGDDVHVRQIENMPRVVLGLSQASIARLAPAWAKNPHAFDLAAVPEFRQVKRSAVRQLVSQIELAAAEQRRGKRRQDGKPSAELDQLRAVLAALNSRGGGRGAGVGTDIMDPVVKRINDAVTNRNTRERLIAEAKRAQAEWHSGFAVKEEERKKQPEFLLEDTEPLLPSDEAKLAEHFSKHVSPADRQKAEPALRAFLAADPAALTPFPKELLPIIAGGVPVRLWRRLKKAAEPVTTPAEPPAHVPAPAHEAATDVHSAAHETHTESHETHTHASAAMHLGAIGAAGAGLAAAHAGGRFEKRGSRWWSRMKNAVLHAATTGAAYAAGLSAKWLLCGLGAGLGGMFLGGAAAGMGVGFGLWKYWKKKGYYDDVMERERAAARAKIAQMQKTHPVYHRRVTANEAAYAAEVEKIANRYWRYNTAVLGLANLAASTGLLQWQTGGKFLPTLGSDIAAGNWKLGNTLALFACTTPAWGSGKSAAAAAAVPGGRGGTGAASALPPGGRGANAAAVQPGGRGNTLVQPPPNRTGAGQYIVDQYGRKISHINGRPVGSIHPAELSRMGMRHPWSSWYDHGIFAEGPRRPRGVVASCGAHMNACYEGLMVNQRWDAHMPSIQTRGSGYWNSSTYGSLQHSLGFPRR